MKKAYFLLMMAEMLVINMLDFTAITTASAAENKITVVIGSAVNEFDSIQEAVDSVNDGESAEIQVPTGTYNEAVTITNTKGTLNRTIVLKGAQAGNSAVVNGKQRNDSETILTGGIEVNGLHESASLTIDGFTLHNKGINIQGWGNLIDTTGELKIMNNVITDIENGSLSAIHVNTNATTEFIGAFEASDNYIAQIGQADFAVNGIYFTITANTMKIKNNVIRDVNHSCINFSSATIKNGVEITDNVFMNWNRDGIAGSGAGGSQGDGIYITKTKTANTVPIEIHHNVFTRAETLEGNKGYATRCSLNQGKIDLSENFWDTKFPYQVISGLNYANVTLLSVCDETMTVKPQAVSNFTFTTSDLYLGGKYAERKLSANVMMLDKTAVKPEVVFINDSEDTITLDIRDDGVYAVADQAGEAKITAILIDPASNEEYQIEGSFLVKAIEMKDQEIAPDQTVQMAYQVLPNAETFPSYYKIEWTSSDETVATVDENGLVSSTGKEGTTKIEVTVKSFGTIYYQTSATVTVKEPFVNTEPIIYAEDKTLIIGELFEALEDVTATDQEDGDITAALEVVKNEVDNTAAGIYKVVYRVTDSAGATVEKTITVTVKEPETVTVEIQAILDAYTEMSVFQKQVVKGSEMDIEFLKELNDLLNELNTADTFRGYRCKGFFSDKEGMHPLQLGDHFDENKLIYMIWELVPDDNPKPVDPDTPDQPEQPEEPDQPIGPVLPEEPEQPQPPEKPIKPEKPIVPTNPKDPNKPQEPIQPIKPNPTEQPDNRNDVDDMYQTNESVTEDKNSVNTGDMQMLGLYLSMCFLTVFLITVFFPLKKNVK